MPSLSFSFFLSLSLSFFLPLSLSLHSLRVTVQEVQVEALGLHGSVLLRSVLGSAFCEPSR